MKGVDEVPTPSLVPGDALNLCRSRGQAHRKTFPMVYNRGMPEDDNLPPDIERIFASKREWHKKQAHKPVKEKVRDLLQMQRDYYPPLKAIGKLKSWSRPWDIEPLIYSRMLRLARQCLVISSMVVIPGC